jgi:gas vesicle protein
MSQDSRSSSTVGTAITFLLIGLGAGALVGLMFAPKAGKQMRRELGRRYRDVRENLEDWSGDAQEFVETAMERGSEIADEIRERVKPIARNLRRS